MKQLLTRIARTLEAAALRCLRRMTVSDGLLALAAVLFLLDHRFSDLTWGAIALAAGALLIRGMSGRKAGPLRVQVRRVPAPAGVPDPGETGMRERESVHAS